MFKNIKSSKNSGSVLLMALIFSFVIMVMLTGLLYSFKMGLLTTKSIIKNSNEKVLGETYIANAKDDIDFSKSSKLKVGDSTFEIAVNEDDISTFFPKNSNAELFQAQEYSSFKATYKAYNDGSKVDLTKEIIYNAPSANIYKNYNTDYVPINVPMIDVAAITDYQARNYRLTSDGQLKDAYKGFIGFIEKQNKQINIFTNKAKIGVPIPQGMGTDYKIKVGWNLENGKWLLMLLMYDINKLFTTTVALEDLLADEVEGLEPDTKSLGDEIGKWQPVIAGDSESGSTGAPFVKENIFDAAWYFEDSDGPPQILLIRKGDQKKGNQEVLEVYYSAYSTTNNQYSLKQGDNLNLKAELKEENVKILVPDFANNLDAKMAFIFHPNNQSKNLTGVSDFNYNGDHRVGKSLDTYIDGESFGNPVIISKSEDSLFIVTFEPDKLHRYEYKKGLGGFVSLDFGVNGLEKELKSVDDESDVFNLYSSKDDSDSQNKDVIEQVIPKFGYLFVFTKTKVSQMNDNFDTLQEIESSGKEPQILADLEAVKNTINKIYIQSKALDAKVEEIQDKLGDEPEPKDKNEIEDRFKKSNDNKIDIKSSQSNNRQDQGDSSGEEPTPAPVYLDSKYFYPLGVVKQITL
ncbi:hypothetical protein IB642_04440 [Allofrancisella guangzhouensis]|uniref:Membrane protein n=1 Tax=Allofrancisella guangzhouensis TaxID=594679 RepID=A0A0A8E536_9GAMM|nr:hypothetical protein [Allofrancisella guangzhouensis]AJC48712.1 membrane protein [Allofrancisella guangzhouensis]MBK2026806.1 hypothetical protein [Allofrancisella guangzhouensis]MBK2044267.1 hypothetical protein [Allofrancisella guangzhouensis]MBK2045175.1 hypothetical protein [Allofrancisella guangzhouensis]